MNNYTQPMNQPQGQMLNVILVPNIDMINNYPINPGGSTLFLTQDMKQFVMKSKDPNGFPLPDRTWELNETTPPPVTQGQFATRAEVDAINSKLDKIMNVLSKFTE